MTVPNVVDILIKLTRIGSGVSDAVGELKGLDVAAATTSQRLSAMGGSLSSAGMKMTLAISAPLAALGTVALKAAADDASAMAKTEVVFGSAAAAVVKFASTSVKSLGMSDDAALSATSSFGAFFTAMGVGQTSAAGMSTRLVQLAADVAAYNHITTAEAADKLTSGLQGVYRSLKDVNVIMTEAEVNNRAVADGMADSTTSVSEAAAVTARYELLLEKTSLQQGYLATHSDSLAASTNRAKAELDNAAAALGTALIPMAVTAANKVADLATAFTNLGPATQSTIVTFGAIALAAGPVTTALGALLKVASTLVTALPAIAAFLAGVGGAAIAAAAGVAGLVTGLALLGNQATARTLTDEETDRLIGLPTQAQLQARLNNDLTAIAVLKQQLAANPQDTGASVNLALYENDVSKVTVALSQLSAIGTSAVRDVSVAAAAGGAAFYSMGEEARQAGLKVMATLEAAKGQALLSQFGNSPDLIERKTLIASGQLNLPPVSVYQKAIDAADAARQKGIQLAQTAADQARTKGIQLAQSAAEKAVSAIQKKFEALASAITSAIDGAREKAKGLFPLGGTGPGGINIEPGKGGPFEGMYRITDLAATEAGRAPGKDTATWRAMYGPGLTAAGTTATAAATAFQAGDLFAPGVASNVNWQQFGEQAAAGQRASKISTYAGQAAAGLIGAGKPLTAESMKAAVDALAAKDKEGIVPSLTDINAAIAATGATEHTDFANTITAINSVTGAINGKAAPTTPSPPGGVTVPPGTVKLGVPVNGRASGGLASGWTLAGEGGGPELINLPMGSRVYPAGQTREMLQGGGGNGAGEFLQGLRDALGPGAASLKEAGAALADMLTGAASNIVMNGMLKEYNR